MADIDMVIALVLSIQDSLKKYDEERIKQKRNPPWCGYGVSKEDSKESIKRRILVAREELLRLSKALEE